MKTIKLAGVIFILILFNSLLYAQSYYVDNVNGNDGNNGTSIATPWRTLTKINNTTFAPGVKILFKASGIWSGQLYPKGSGTSGNPITIDMYGTGSKPLLTGSGSINYVVRLHNQNYWEINNLEITNPSATEADRLGVRVSADDGLTHRHIYLKNLEIHDIKGRYTFDMTGKNTGGIGMRITGGGSNTRYDDVLIEKCEIYNIVRVGISCSSTQSSVRDNRPITNMRVRENVIHHCAGDGLILRLTNNAVVENNLAYENHNANESQVQHGVALWCRSTDNTIFQKNEVYNTRGVLDGQAFDADFEAYGTIFQHNYTHDNEGGFLLLMNGTSGTQARYNISENDGAKANHVIYFSSWDPGGNPTRGAARIYNNTFYVPSGAVFSDQAMASSEYNNNIIYKVGSGNIQNASSGQTAKWDYNLIFGSTSLPSDPHLITSNPQLVNPGSGGVGMNTVDGYKLKSGSPALSSGLLISGNAAYDYYSNPVATTVKPHRGAYNGSAIGQAPVANFSANKNSACIDENITFSNSSSGNIVSYSWNFGSGAMPSTASGIGPHSVQYSTSGSKTISLSVTGPDGNDTETKTNSISVQTCGDEAEILYSVKDAYVRDGSYSSTTFGTTDASNLVAKYTGADNNGFNREAYLSFDLSSISETINKVELKVYSSSGAPAIPVTIHPVASSTWSETGINWSNKPASASAIASTIVNGSGYYTWDVTNYIKSEKAAGRNSVSFAMKNAAISNPQTMWNSKESTDNRPFLSITTDTTSTPPQGTCSGAAPNGDYTYTVSAVGNTANVKFVPGAPVAGTTMVILNYKIGSGGYMGVFMDASTDGNYVETISANQGATLTFYFTYRIGTTTMERNSSATPHTYEVGSVCTARIGKLGTQPLEDIRVYPNPTTGITVFSGNVALESETTILIINSYGEELVISVYSAYQNSFEQSVDLTSLLPGMYVIKITSGEKIWTKSLVKQ